MSAPPVGGSFTLVDHHHNRVTEASYRGKYVLLFFGFTHCRQVCPAALLKLSTALLDRNAATRRTSPTRWWPLRSRRGSVPC